MAAEQYVNTLFYISAAEVVSLQIPHYYTRISGNG